MLPGVTASPVSSLLSRRSALAFCAAAPLAGCGRSTAGGALSIWGPGLAGELLPALLPPFSRETGIAVDVQAISSTEAHEKVVTAFAGGALPDVLMVSDDWLPELAAIGAIRPLPDADAALAGQLPAAAGLMRVAGRAFAVPLAIDTQAQFFRTDLAAAAGYPEPPPRRADWIAMLRAIKRRAPDRFALLMLLDWPEHLLTFAAQNGAAPLRDRNSRGNFASPAFRAALATYKALFDEGLAPRVTLADIGDPVTAFWRGLFAVMPSSSYMIGDLSRRAADLPRERWRVAPMPGPDGAGATPVGGSSLVVTAHARDPARAWALARFLGRADTQLRLCAFTGELPTREAAWDAPAMRREPAFAVFRDQLARPVPPPAIPEWPHVQVEMQYVAERVARGELGVDAAAREMDRRADALLAKRRWLLDRGRAA